MISSMSPPRIGAGPQSEDPKRLLAGAPVIKDGCDLDLLVFLHRHPRTLLTSEQLAAFVGYDMKQVAETLDAFVDAGILERIQSSSHAARMYLLSANGPQGGGLKPLLNLASTREGRRKLLETLNGRRSRTKGARAKPEIAQDLRLVKRA
jgi:hypothetical protein